MCPVFPHVASSRRRLGGSTDTLSQHQPRQQIRYQNDFNKDFYIPKKPTPDKQNKTKKQQKKPQANCSTHQSVFGSKNSALPAHKSQLMYYSTAMLNQNLIFNLSREHPSRWEESSLKKKKICLASIIKCSKAEHKKVCNLRCVHFSRQKTEFRFYG